MGLKRQRYGHLVTRMLAGTACAISPHFERELLFLHDPEAQTQEEQGLPSEPEDFMKSQRTRIDEQRLDQRLPDAAALLIVADREAGDFGEGRAVNLETARTHDRPIRCDRDHVFLDVTAQVVV